MTWLVCPRHYLARRLESAEAASCFVVLLVLLLLNAFEALEAILEDVLTLFLGIRPPPSCSLEREVYIAGRHLLYRYFIIKISECQYIVRK